jgi:hypothetical protein
MTTKNHKAGFVQKMKRDDAFLRTCKKVEDATGQAGDIFEVPIVRVR